MEVAIVRFRAESAYDVLAKIEFVAYVKDAVATPYLEDRLILKIRSDLRRLALELAASSLRHSVCSLSLLQLSGQ